MKLFKWLGFSILVGLFSGCASTEKQIYTDVKRPLTSDFELAMSLLRRPIPDDQLMMLAFARQQEVQWGATHYVNILGSKEASPKPIETSILYTHIANDVNTISLIAPE